MAHVISDECVSCGTCEGEQRDELRQVLESLEEEAAKQNVQ